MNIEKIKKILEDKYERMRIEFWHKMKSKAYLDYVMDDLCSTKRMNELWTKYMNSLDCTLITEEDIKEDLEGIINDSSQGRVCIRMGDEHDDNMLPPWPNSKMDRHYILMPQDLADKVLVLGELPDFAEA